MRGTMPPLLLIITSDIHLSYLLKRYGETFGLRTQSLSKGDGIVLLVRREIPVAIFVDEDIPGKEFRGIVEDLSSDDTLSNIPIISCGWKDAEASAQANGITARVSKSMLYNDFENTLKGIGVTLENNTIRR